MPSRIRVLDNDTINKIAAGEVVERPASIVKELVENALDSGAMSISVSIQDGGRTSISVRDDGSGMTPEDAVAAFQRHATSKISSIEDLERLGSYGFRGEALSSIAAVSKVTIKTREHDSTEGFEIVVDGGRLVGSSPVGCPPGTEVLVEAIFEKTPARRKSLKSRGVEAAHCRDVVTSYILCKPELSFSYKSDEDALIVHSPAEGMNGSLATAFGSQVSENMLLGHADGDGIGAEAYLGRLEHTRSSQHDLKLFVNGRPVRSQRLVSAAVEGYGSRLMKDRYPVGVLMLTIDPSKVDVNVHPSKREVRFGDELPIRDLVHRCVEDALKDRDLSQQFELTKFSEVFSPAAALKVASAVGPDHTQTVLAPAEETDGTAPKTIVPLAQIMDTYILAQSSGGLVLVDQHAASERVVYENILKGIESKADVSQRLLSPFVLHLSGAEERALEENRESLEQAGFVIEKFGRDAHAMRALPTVLGVAQGESAFRNILGDLAGMSPSKKLGLEVIWRVACHTAIRAGEPLSRAQMHQLLSELAMTENPYTCEHGRPTMVVLSQADLERLFKRRV